MSYERGMAAIRLQSPDEIPQTQYISHPRLATALTGLAPDDPRLGEEYARVLDLDLHWSTDAPQVQGRLTNMGHAVWLEDGSDFDTNIQCPFATPEEVLAFDPVAEYGIPDVDEQAARYQAQWTATQRQTDGVLTGGIYRTLFSFAIAAFGWDMFLTAAALDEERFDRVLDGFFRIIMAYTQAWAKTDLEVFLTHDDIVWTQGAVFHPDWYRRHVFPRYRAYWEVVRDAGKPVLFCSDGDYTEFIDDLAAAGAQGFIFEPLTDLDYVVSRYGKTHVIIGNADTRILTFGSKEQVWDEVRRCIDAGRDCPGYFFAIGNHIPHNVPVENAVECFRAYWALRRRR